MNNLIKQGEDLLEYVKRVILKYCPYTEDRLDILGNAKSPQIEINVNIDCDKSQISFLFGNNVFKQGVSEKILISSVIDFAVIQEIINFLLLDRRTINNFDMYENEVFLIFSINWCNESIKGINCGDIKLNLVFNNNTELEKEFLFLLFSNYFNYLNKIPSFKRIENEYINSIKHNYFNSLDKTYLIDLLNRMEEDELKELLCDLENDLFIKYAFDTNSKYKIKKMLLEK